MDSNVKKIITYMMFLFWVGVNISSCTSTNTRQKDYSIWVALGFVQSLGDYWAKMYKFDPDIVYDPTNIFLLNVASKEMVKPNRTAVVLISGWNYHDRSTGNYPSLEELKNRALNVNWGHLVKKKEFILLIQNYDVYTFSYLTSDPIDTNGYRLRIWLDKVFSGINQKVIIFAHSMGGLVTRFAIYHNDIPSYIKAIVTAGTPYHGSPWASPQYQKDKSVLGDLAAFLTDTEGGKDLAWDNYDNSLAGASNPKLTQINQKTDRDYMFHALYGDVPGGNNYASDSSRTFGSLCTVLNDFAPNDCVVPIRSAYLDGHTMANTQDLGKYDHIDINWNTPIIRSLLLDYINGL